MSDVDESDADSLDDDTGTVDYGSSDPSDPEDEEEEQEQEPIPKEQSDDEEDDDDEEDEEGEKKESESEEVEAPPAKPAKRKQPEAPSKQEKKKPAAAAEEPKVPAPPTEAQLRKRRKKAEKAAAFVPSSTTDERSKKEVKNDNAYIKKMSGTVSGLRQRDTKAGSGALANQHLQQTTAALAQGLVNDEAWACREHCCSGFPVRQLLRSERGRTWRGKRSQMLPRLVFLASEEQPHVSDSKRAKQQQTRRLPTYLLARPGDHVLRAWQVSGRSTAARYLFATPCGWVGRVGSCWTRAAPIP